MIAHIIHDNRGTIRSIVFQGAEVEGSLEIQPDEEGEFVTTVDLDEVFPESRVDTGADSGSSRHHLHLIASEIRTGFRLNAERKTLERLK